MGGSAITNLDYDCAKAGNEINESEKVIVDALAVVEEQGLYAMFLFLKSKQKKADDKESNIEKVIRETLGSHDLLPSTQNLYSSLKDLSKNLDDLLLARDLVRRILVYALYHAKVRSKDQV